MFTTSPNEIEASDIDAVQRAGDAVTLMDGRVALPVLLILSEHSGKTYGGGSGVDFPTSIHLTNGVQARQLPILPVQAQFEDARSTVAADPSEPESSEPQSAPATGVPNVGIEMSSADGEQHEATLAAAESPTGEADESEAESEAESEQEA